MKSISEVTGKSEISKCGEGDWAHVRDTTIEVGELKWVKLPGGLWWPGQAVDENIVCENKKAGKKSPEEVLVRLYGTYNYSYIDPIKSQLEFEIILKQNNGSHRKIFQQSLEKDLSHNKPRGLKVSGLKSKANARTNASGGEKSRKKEKSGELGKYPDMKKGRGNTVKTHNQSSDLKLSEKKGRVKDTAERSGVNSANSLSPKKRLKVDSSSTVRSKNEPRHTGFEIGVKPKTLKDKEQTAKTGKEKKRRKSEHGETCNESKPNNKIEDSPRHKTPKKNEISDGSSPEITPSQKSEQLSARRVKVMQNLGLIAPSGSPFFKNDHADLTS